VAAVRTVEHLDAHPREAHVFPGCFVTGGYIQAALIGVQSRLGARHWGVEAMQALTLMIVYVLTTASVQFIGFLISRLVDYEWPTLGLMTFLILFMGAFGIAWPIAVRITEWLIRRAGYVVETEQSGGDARRDVLRKKAST
jgi:hypothetical protein